MRHEMLMLRCTVLLVASASLMSGCVVVAVTGAAVSLATTAVKVTAKTAVKVVEVAIPDGDSEGNEKDKSKKSDKK